ncbi:MAG: GUN4 domain-containing protein [Coleofasciculaceae cyanobacterium]
MPKKVALLIGVSESENHTNGYSKAINNVTAMQRVLEDQNRGGFDHVESLQNPSQETIQKAIEKVFAKCSGNDLALLYFSGHCLTDEAGHLYFASNNTAHDNFQSTAVPASFIQLNLSISDAERQLIILDCNYELLTDSLLAKNVSVNLRNELGAKGRTILTSSTLKTSLEAAQTSPYTQYLVEGIETGAADPDGAGLIYVQELHYYAKRRAEDLDPQVETDLIRNEKDYDILLAVLLNAQGNGDVDAEYRKIEAKYGKIVESYGRVGEIPNIVNYTLNKKQKVGITIDKDAPDILSSERDIDYTRLRDLLKAGNWKEADHETLLVILKAAGREGTEYLTIESIESFPCADLHTVDQLWFKYSGGQFGFSLQKEIWLSVGGELGEYNNATYEQFGLRVGWRDRNGVKILRGWTKYDDLNFSLTWAPVGHLPTLASGKNMQFEQLNFWGIRSDFFSRMDACWV